VPFKKGFSTDTYRYFSDFAACNGIEYINLDEGWSITQFDLLKPTDKLNRLELTRYAKESGLDSLVRLAQTRPADDPHPRSVYAVGHRECKSRFYETRRSAGGQFLRAAVAGIG
jgi:hypothetical protein